MGGNGNKMVEANNKIALIFPGQGSQYVGMGKDFYHANNKSKAIFDKSDEVLGFSLSKLCFEGPQEELSQTKNCQAAIFTCSIAILEALRAAKLIDFKDIICTGGLSLGEYTSLVCTGVLNFEDGLRLVKRRGDLMQEAASKFPSGMVSIIGLDLEQVKAICEQTKTEVANLNSPGQVVVSATLDKLPELERVAKEKGAKRAIRLDVSAGFHSSLMKEAASELKQFIDGIVFNDAAFEIVSNVDALGTKDKFKIKDNLIKQMYSPVFWQSCMGYMKQKNVSRFFEVGPGRVLKGLARRIDSSLTVLNIEKQEDFNEVRK